MFLYLRNFKIMFNFYKYTNSLIKYKPSKCVITFYWTVKKRYLTAGITPFLINLDLIYYIILN